MKKLSLIIPCYNAAATLPECFESVKNQTTGLDDVEVVFVNDASTDDGRTAAMLEGFCSEIPGVSVIHLPENKRQGGARNVALGQITGEYVGFLDSDDHIAPDYCEKLLRLAYDNEADIVQFGHYEYIKDDNGQPVTVREVRFEQEVSDIEGIDERRNFVMFGNMTPGHWDKLYRRSLIEEAGVRFGENVIYEEPLFTYPLKYYVRRFVVTDEVLHYNYLRMDSTMRKGMKDPETIKDHMSQQQELYEFMKKSSFYEDYGTEIDFNFFHSYVVETMIFSAKNRYGMKLPLYETMRRTVFKKLGRSVKNAYITPQTLHYTILDVLKKDGMTQAALNEIINALSELG